MGKLALVVGTRASRALVFATHLKLQPERVLAVEHHIAICVILLSLCCMVDVESVNERVS